MPFTHHHTTTRTTRTTRPRRHGLFSRAQPVHHPVHHTAHHPAVHQKRHATLGDKISGALLKLKGTLMHRPGQKAAGTRRMRGTDGRGSHHGSKLSSRRKYRY
ncbi:hypothetical protein F5Y14DRAFT_453315 [Nemania sp. NC0429]|nr:hypothetical protein F5Y14DRAFT_453315 [Nemania sp. NC0429]